METKEYKLTAYKFSERKPTHGTVCWVNLAGIDYASAQMYNEKQGCWSTRNGHDYEFDLNDDDVYFELPLEITNQQ